MTLILGAYIGHDANFCLVRDGVVVGCVEAERTTRWKHQDGLQRGVLDGFLRDVGGPIEPGGKGLPGGARRGASSGQALQPAEQAR